MIPGLDLDDDTLSRVRQAVGSGLMAKLESEGLDSLRRIYEAIVVSLETETCPHGENGGMRTGAAWQACCGSYDEWAHDITIRDRIESLLGVLPAGAAVPFRMSIAELDHRMRACFPHHATGPGFWRTDQPRNVLPRIRARRITPWETPVTDQARLLMVSLTDQHRQLVGVFEASWEPGRPRWRVVFTQVQSYRVCDESRHTTFWEELRSVGRPSLSTFTIEDSAWSAQLTGLTPRPRHYVIATLDDVVEVAACAEPVWERAAPAPPAAPMPGKSEHYFIPEDREAVDDLVRRIQMQQPPAEG